MIYRMETLDNVWTENTHCLEWIRHCDMWFPHMALWYQQTIEYEVGIPCRVVPVTGQTTLA